MAIVLDPVYGPKPALSLANGSPTTLARGSSPFLPGGRSITLTGDGWRTVSFEKLYRSQPLIATAAKRLTEAIAQAPLHINRYLDDAGDARQRERVHPAAQLLERPRPGRTGFHLRWETALSLYVHGHYLAWKHRPGRGAPPDQLWTLDWRYVIPHRAGDAGPVIAWEWTGQGIPDVPRFIDPADVVSIGFTPPNGADVGVSPIEQLGVTIRLDDAVRRHAEASFRNGTRFGALVRLNKDVKADQVIRDGLRQELIDAHGGVDQAFRPAILGGGVEDIETISQSAVEAELINQRKLDRDEVASVYGGAIGPLLGALDAANYASISEFHRILYVTVLPGPMGLIAAGYQAQLLSEPAWAGDGLFSEFSLDSVLKGDAKQRWDTYAVALDHGGLTLNDVRRKENLPPYDDPRADEPLIAANNVRPLSAVGTGPTGNATPGRRATDQAAARTVLELTGHHATRAFDRAARGAGAGRAPLEALDSKRVARELAADLEAAGLNGSSSVIAELVAAEFEHLLAEASSVDDVRAVASAYPLTTGETA